MAVLGLLLVIGIANLAYDYYWKHYGEEQFIKEQKQAVKAIKTNPKLVAIEEAKWYAQDEVEEAARPGVRYDEGFVLTRVNSNV